MAVCADGPLLVHLTADPTVTVTAAGENEKSWMVTPTTEPLGGMFPPPPPELRPVEVPQAALARSSACS